MSTADLTNQLLEADLAARRDPDDERLAHLVSTLQERLAYALWAELDQTWAPAMQVVRADFLRKVWANEVGDPVDEAIQLDFEFGEILRGIAQYHVERVMGRVDKEPLADAELRLCGDCAAKAEGDEVVDTQ